MYRYILTNYDIGCVSLYAFLSLSSNSEDKRTDKRYTYDILINIFKKRHEFHGFRLLDRVM
jgi:hypothetical protein